MNPENQLPILCRNLRYLRKSNNLTKTQMTKILGTSMRSLNSIERGICPQRLGTNVLDRACRHFDLTLKDLFAPLE